MKKKKTLEEGFSSIRNYVLLNNKHIKRRSKFTIEKKLFELEMKMVKNGGKNKAELGFYQGLRWSLGQIDVV